MNNKTQAQEPSTGSLVKIRKGKDLRLVHKLPLLVVSITALAGAAVGYSSFHASEKQVLLAAEERLEIVAHARAEEVHRYLESSASEVRLQAKSGVTQNAIAKFSNAWAAATSSERGRIAEKYTADRSNLSSGSNAGGGLLYANAHEKFNPWFQKLLEEKNYHDIALVDAAGNIVYTAKKNSDFFGSVRDNNNLRDSGIGKAYAAASQQSGLGEVSFQDFSSYEPAGKDEKTGFLSSPVFDRDGVLSGVLIAQIGNEVISSIAAENTGFKESGRTWFVGTKSQQILSENKLKTEEARVDAQVAIQEVFSKKSQRYVEVGSSIYAKAPMHFKNLDWYAIVSAGHDEVLAPVSELKVKVIRDGIIAIIILSILGAFVARRVARRIATLSEAVKQIAEQKPAEIPYIHSTDELGDVARSIQLMTTRMQAAVRLQSALDNVTANVMMADEDLNIIYMNEAVTGLLRNAEKDLRTALPSFDHSKLMGQNIDGFHANPAHQRGLLGNLKQTYRNRIEVAGRTFDLIVNPVFDTHGERLGSVVEWSDRTEEVAVEKEINQVVAASAAGDFTCRLDTDNKNGFLKNLCEGINSIGEIAYDGLSEVGTVIDSLSQGDLTKNMTGEYKGMFDDIKISLNATINQMGDMVSKIQTSGRAVNEASSEISTGSMDLSHRTEQQASTLEETAASMEELTGTVRQNGDNAKQANGVAQEASNVAAEGGDVVERAVSAMQRIEESSRKISDIISVIDEIAFQTNLLALNAAVEAARAGEAGKGFAVVAAEVRTLAGRSAEASKDIKSLISDSGKQVDVGAELVNEAGKNLKNIVQSVKEVADLISEIANASSEQTLAIEEINTSVAQMDEGTQQNAALVEENSAAAQSLVRQSEELAELISFFKLDESQLKDIGNKRPSGGSVIAAIPASPSKTTQLEQSTRPRASKAASAGGGARSEGWEEF